MEDIENKATVETLKRLFIIHERRYTNIIRMAEKRSFGYRKEEAVGYLNLWKEVKAKGFIYNNLTSQAKAEVRDAIEDEE